MFRVLSYRKWMQAVEKTQQITSKLHEKYPELRAQPVFSLRGCQANLTTDVEMILDCLPEMICGEELKSTLSLYYQDRTRMRRKYPGSKTVTQLNRNVDILEKQLWFEGITRVDLNMFRSSPELIHQMLRDPLINQSLSCFNTSEFARISLGSLASLAGDI